MYYIKRHDIVGMESERNGNTYIRERERERERVREKKKHIISIKIEQY